VTSWRGWALCVSVFGKPPADQPVAETSPPVRKLDGGGGLTRYARPCLPVKPLLMMDDVGTRSARHFWQRRCDVGRVARKLVGCGGDEDGEATVELVASLTAELRRRRKGRLGKR